MTGPVQLDAVPASGDSTYRSQRAAKPAGKSVFAAPHRGTAYHRARRLASRPLRLWTSSPCEPAWLPAQYGVVRFSSAFSLGSRFCFSESLLISWSSRPRRSSSSWAPIAVRLGADLRLSGCFGDRAGRWGPVPAGSFHSSQLGGFHRFQRPGTIWAGVRMLRFGGGRWRQRSPRNW